MTESLAPRSRAQGSGARLSRLASSFTSHQLSDVASPGLSFCLCKMGIIMVVSVSWVILRLHRVFGP